MRISLFSILDAYAEHRTGGRDRYRELLDLAAAGETAGLDALWVAEHHFQPGGICPAPPVLLAAAGARTRRIRLGCMVSVLPFHAPLELAESYALLDRLLGGRLNLGVGSGYIPMEFEGFGLDPEAKRERFDSALAFLLAAFRGDEVVAAPGRSTPVRLNVLPVQAPHPPLWIAVQRSEAVPFVARRGMNLALVPYATLGSPEELRPLIDAYRRDLPAGVPGTVSAALHVYVGPQLDAARAALQRFLDSRRATQSTFYLRKVEADPRHASAEHLEAAGLAALGPPDAVRPVLERYRAAGVDELLAIVDFGGLAPYRVAESVTALGALGAGP